MPVSSEISVTDPYYPNGVTVSFGFDFKAASATEVVAVDGDGNTISTALYTVTLDEDEGGTLTFGTAPTAEAYPVLYVVSEPALTQPSNFDNSGPSFNPAGVTRAFDRAGVRDLKLKRMIDRGLSVPFGESGLVLPSAEVRAGKFAAFDGEGGAVAVPGALMAPAIAVNVVTNGGGNVQESLDDLGEATSSLLDLKLVRTITEATALGPDDLNKTIVIDGDDSFTTNLPTVSAVGQALVLKCARGYTGVATIQSSVTNACNVDGTSALDLMGGEAAIFVFDGDEWGVQHRDFVPIKAQMISAAADFPIGTTWDEVPMSVAGDQLMRNDVKGLWNFSGGFFTAPRAGTYVFECSMWVQHTDGGGPGFYDFGGYVGSATGGTPNYKNFNRKYVTDLGAGAFESLPWTRTFSMNKGEKLFLSIEADGLTNPKVVTGGTLPSALNVHELRV